MHPPPIRWAWYHHPGGLLATIQIGITLAGFLASASASESFADPLVTWLVGIGTPLSAALMKTIVVFLITIVLSYFTLVFGELVPKRLAMQRAEGIALFAIRPLTLLSKAAAPFIHLLTASTDGIVRLLGIDPAAREEEATEEEIRMMVDVGGEHGTIDESEKAMIHNIFEFDDKVVSQVMTHRTAMVGIEVGTSLEDLMETLSREKYTRFPVYQENPDHVLGILHVKDLLEELVGEIDDEYGDLESASFTKVDDRTWLVSGTTNLTEVAATLNLSLPIDTFTTLSGYVVGLLGRIPDPGEHPAVKANGIQYSVEPYPATDPLQENPLRIRTVRIRLP